MDSKILESYIRSLLQERGGWGRNVDRVIKQLGSKILLSDIFDEVYYALELEEIGEGTFRRVFEIDNDWVLKVALDPEVKSRLANKIEANPKLQSLMYPYVPQTIANGRYFGWIISEKCSKTYDFKQWLSHLGIPYRLISRLSDYRMSDVFNLLNYVDKFKDEANNDFIRKLMIAHNELGIDVRDIRAGNIGYGNDGRPVILDTGLDKDRSKHNM